MIDQTSKWYICGLVDRLPFDLLNGVLQINLVYNTGGAFGVFRGAKYLFISVSIAAILYIAYLLLYADKKEKLFSMPMRVSLGMVMGGAISNLIDRIRFGYVIDFLDFKVWPVFNGADICITTGVIVLLIAYFARRK